jgi:large subunit ribosomal protein L21
MYAIVKHGNKSFRAEKGALLQIDLVAGLKKGDKVTLDQVQFVGGEKPRVGTPTVKGAKVVTEVVTPLRKGEKLIAFKYKRRKGFEKKKGHRQRYTEVRVVSVEG